MQNPSTTNGLNGGGAVQCLLRSVVQMSLPDNQQASPLQPQPTALFSENNLEFQNSASASGWKASDKLSAELQENEKPPQPQPHQKQKRLDVARYVGFANLPNQVYRRAVKRGFEFSLMVVGESGLGKSTLINSMFLSDIYNTEHYPGPSLRRGKTVAVEATKVLLKENGVNLTLTVVDTPGFGDAIDNTNCWVPILEYIDKKYEEYFTAESRVYRAQVADQRVHCCLYFIPPSGHGLRPLDIACMKSLCDKVNLVPIIAKADTLTPDEVQLFKKQILNEIVQHNIKIYAFHTSVEDIVDEETKNATTQNLRNRVPFAVVGANSIVVGEGGKKVRGRKYPWGLVEMENLSHCDFIALRNMVIRTHLQDLKDVTNDVHYENYRCRKLSALDLVYSNARLCSNNPLAQMEEEKRQHDHKLERMEAEMEFVFQKKVKEKLQKLRDSEAELARQHEERKAALELQKSKIEEQRREFERSKQEWEKANPLPLEKWKRHSLGAHCFSDNGDSKKDRKKKGLF